MFYFHWRWWGRWKQRNFWITEVTKGLVMYLDVTIFLMWIMYFKRFEILHLSFWHLFSTICQTNYYEHFSSQQKQKTNNVSRSNLFQANVIAWKPSWPTHPPTWVNDRWPIIKETHYMINIFKRNPLHDQTIFKETHYMIKPFIKETHYINIYFKKDTHYMIKHF